MALNCPVLGSSNLMQKCFLIASPSIQQNHRQISFRCILLLSMSMMAFDKFLEYFQKRQTLIHSAAKPCLNILKEMNVHWLKKRNSETNDISFESSNRRLSNRKKLGVALSRGWPKQNLETFKANI